VGGEVVAQAPLEHFGVGKPLQDVRDDASIHEKSLRELKSDEFGLFLVKEVRVEHRSFRTVWIRQIVLWISKL
jgi:hypothetical protein